MALGETFRKAREAMGLTPSDVADQTHIMSTMVREIEAEDYHRFSAPIYGKGFIKLYAKFLGLDPAPLVAEFLATVGDAGSTKQNAFVALETIDTEHGGGITIVKPEGQPQPVPRPSSMAAPAAPVPHHVVAKASMVTLPSTDAPHPLPGPNKPTPKPAPSQPAAASPPLQSSAPASPPKPEEAQKPRSTAADIRSGDAFRLEAEPAVPAVPPQPVPQAAEPFKFPTPKPALAQKWPETPKAKAPEADEDDDDIEIVEKAPPRRRPQNRRRPEAPPVSELIKRLQSGASAFLAAFRQRAVDLLASDDEEESRTRRRYLLSGISVFAVVMLILFIAGRKPAPESDTGRAQPASAEVAKAVDEAVPVGPVEIVRVLPPPKVFAK